MVFASILDYLEGKLSGEEGYLNRYAKMLKRAGMVVSFDGNMFWQKLSQAIYDEFYQEYYPKWTLFHREKVWRCDLWT